MQTVEDKLIEILKQESIDTIVALPCDRVKWLLKRVAEEGSYVPITREEEGVGIAAGVVLAGGKAAMIIQSSGYGNMINAILSLTQFYRLSLPVFISHRGIYKEKIEAQKPMGRALKGLLKASGVGYTVLQRPEDLEKIRRPLERVFRDGRVHAFLLSPRLWEGCEAASYDIHDRIFKTYGCTKSQRLKTIKAELTRYEVIEVLRDFIKDEVVVCNLGVPSKELYYVIDQPTNFYMLGSMGMASPIGLGLSLKISRKVFVIDGDGSILMNTGILATISLLRPENLTVFIIDNGVYGSTGGQPTHSFSVVDLGWVCRGFGLRHVYTVSKPTEIAAVLRKKVKGPKVLHIVAKPGNKRVGNIPLSAEQIKNRFMDSLRGG